MPYWKQELVAVRSAVNVRMFLSALLLFILFVLLVATPSTQGLLYHWTFSALREHPSYSALNAMVEPTPEQYDAQLASYNQYLTLAIIAGIGLILAYIFLPVIAMTMISNKFVHNNWNVVGFWKQFLLFLSFLFVFIPLGAILYVIFQFVDLLLFSSLSYDTRLYIVSGLFLFFVTLLGSKYLILSLLISKKQSFAKGMATYFAHIWVLLKKCVVPVVVALLIFFLIALVSTPLLKVSFTALAYVGILGLVLPVAYLWSMLAQIVGDFKDSK
ncbi:MAG TPA: hypothetical protein VK158_01465 [Acidobacteriota bacterium]|nr:hypothetical protein [Acidobacteriota bacterium]